MKNKEIQVYPDLLDAIRKLRTENDKLKVIWEKLKKELEEAEKFIKPMRTEVSRAYHGIILRMHELESGGEVPNAIRGTKSGVLEKPRLLSRPDKGIGTPKPVKR